VAISVESSTVVRQRTGLKNRILPFFYFYTLGYIYKMMLNDVEFSSWLKAVENNIHQARCTLCMKTFELSNMGKMAVSSHGKSVQHRKRCSSGADNHSIGSFVKVHDRVDTESAKSAAVVQPQVSNVESNPSLPSTSTSSEAEPMKFPNSTLSLVKSSACAQTLNTFVLNDSVTKSEILWALKIVMNHMSYRSCLDVGELFQTMFSDSQIAQKFAMSKTKAAYSIVHGLAPYFKEKLDEDIKKCPIFVACFDEALNKIAQRGQMDIVIRYWSEDSNQVATRYFTSVFLGHSTALDLEAKFREGMSSLSLQKLIQVSLDGPSVNWKFLESLQTNLQPDAADAQLLDLGSCGLHVIHGSFQSGHKAAGWTINEALRGLYGLFKDSPARRADYMALTGSSVFPKKFCQVRWLANAEVATRAIEVLPHVKKYVESGKKLPSNVTCRNVTKACEDPLITAKLAFFASVAAMFEPFLRKYQTAEPLAVFLYDDVTNLLRSILQRIVKKPLMEAAQINASKLAKIDLTSAESLLCYKDVDIGVGAQKALVVSKASDREKMDFRMNCVAFLKATALKIIERSPIKYKIVRAISCLSPSTILRSQTISESRMKDLTQYLYDKNRISAVAADRCKLQFGVLCTRVKGDLKDIFASYDKCTERLDRFYATVLSRDEEFSELWSTVKLVMILSHGKIYFKIMF